MPDVEFEVIDKDGYKYTAISDEQKKSMDKMMDMLEEDDDVQNVYHNLED